MLKKIFDIKNIAPVLAFIVSYILLFIAFFLTIRYSRLNPMLYYFGFGFLFVLILLFGVVSYEGIVEKSTKLKMSGTIVLTVISLVLTFGVYTVSRINSSINNVIVDPNQTSVLSTSFVVYDTTSMTELDDLNGQTMGILSNSESLDRNFHVKDEIQAKSLNLNLKEYLSYNELLLALFSGEVDVAALPSDYDNQFGDYEGYAEYLEKTAIIHTFETSVENTSEQVDLDVTKEPFSILIMGNDGGRTDSLIVATFNPIKLSVTMTSIPRDSYVPISCYPNQQKDKIGHAFSVSRDCAIETVENLFDLDISYYIEVNFKGVVEIVDALDKIWVVSPVEFVGQNSDEERGHYTVWVPKGGFWATGEMALALARERYHMPGGDYQRQENQQQVIKSIIDRTLQLKDINKALAVMDAAGNNVKTNMSLDQIISVFNLLMSGINKTNLDPSGILDINGSRVMGYSSYTYNESLQLPLWISIPYNGSLLDLRRLMLSNLEAQTLPEKLAGQFDASLVLYQEDFFSKTYNEKEVHEVLPDFMPTMANNNWTLTTAKEWANKRGINLNIEEIRSGNAAYNANVVHNYIVGQNVKYGVKTANINSLTIKVIKHELNCSLDENKQYEECKYKLPDFQDYGGSMTTISSVKSWFSQLGINVKINYILIPETDSSYDKSKVGYVIKQSPVEWADVRSLSELTLTVMDPNFSIPVPSITGWTETIARKWVKDNLELETNIEVKYEATTDTTLIGSVKSVTPATGQTIKYQGILKVLVYGESYTLSNYVGKTKAEVESTLCSSQVVQCRFIEVESETGTLGTVASQDIAPNTTKLKSEWLNTTVTFEIVKAKGPVTTP